MVEDYRELVKPLAQRVLLCCKKSGDHESQVQKLSMHIRSAPTEPLHCIYTLSLAVVLQGTKQISIDNEILFCSAGQAMLTTFDLPLISHVTEASRHHPFVGMLVKLDYNLILQTAAELNLSKPAKQSVTKSISIHHIDAGLTDALSRLFSLEYDANLRDSLAPLIEKEIVIRLLQGPHAETLTRLAFEGSASSQIVKAVSWLKTNFMRPIEINELAERVHMSASSFRQHFKSTTGTSPLQYLKTLRLQEAREQMLINGLDANQASGVVGYESPSQFSREYSRLFGLPPQKDIQRLKLS
ncbi:AraC family transcriptional regulator [Pseudoalteromonas sp. BMB]|uniref:AraC family transcriptional regulator n=1 Tax=Pseudoalteromonas sp. BMB TaxID=1874619 RepID=UPI00083DC5C6|nr:AraC family transcriptional regulator [Pseudoalteromonas sp. BMB]ODB35388.1 AraC family transcriptional regulator [Pseudoalteromonas sp. BMB]